MRVSLHTFGCKANQYDTEVVRQALEDAGATIAVDGAQFDVAVVNSCTVTHVSEAKMRGLVRRIARTNPEVRTVVMGCAAACDDGGLATLPNVVQVAGGSAPEPVLHALGLPATPIDAVLHSFSGVARAWLKIQDGCDEHCTFCATTVARGGSRSRDPEEIITEASELARRHREIVLTGVHIGSYGRDLVDRIGLGTLVAQLVTRVPDARFRLSSLEATQVEERVVELMATDPARLAPHLHAPLQSGSDRVLKRMGRHWYTAGTYRACIERIADRLPTLGLGADVMVGFPGETEDDFAATVDLVQALPFTYLHVFPYSERPDVAAQRIGPPVDAAVTASRSAILRRVAAEKGAAHRHSRSGGVADVVVLRRSHGRFEALTEDYLTVHVPTDQMPPSRFVARLDFRPDGDLRAEPTA
jgi:threonylcarbamoyladenosine tRNA methylthiotransferase MtaB